MGLFDFVRKEKYINYLANAFKTTYGCGDMAAIHCMRHNYSASELKKILESLKAAEQRGIIHRVLHNDPPFKESHDEVREIDWQYRGG